MILLLSLWYPINLYEFNVYPFFPSKAKVECEKAAVRYHRACGVHKEARETIALAEKKFDCSNEDYEFDAAWQEMLNRETIKVGICVENLYNFYCLRICVFFFNREAVVTRLAFKLKYIKDEFKHFYFCICCLIKSLYIIMCVLVYMYWGHQSFVIRINLFAWSINSFNTFLSF